MIVTPKCAIKNIGNQICSTLHLLVPRPFLYRHCHCTSYLIYHVIPHVYAPILLIFLPFLKTKTALVANKRAMCCGKDGRLFALSESSRYREAQSHSATSVTLT